MKALAAYRASLVSKGAAENEQQQQQHQQQQPQHQQQQQQPQVQYTGYASYGANGAQGNVAYEVYSPQPQPPSPQQQHQQHQHQHQQQQQQMAIKKSPHHLTMQGNPQQQAQQVNERTNNPLGFLFSDSYYHNV